MADFKKAAKKVLLSYRHLPDKKQYVEFFTALLTVPVLITVIILNLNNLKANNNKTVNTTVNTTATVAPEKIYITVPANTTISPTLTPSATQGPCKTGIGSVSIDSPQEGDTVTDNPVSININYTANGYCHAVWSYRINGGGWSNYDNKSIALYNLPQGNVKFDLRVHSITSGGGEKDLSRNFIYKGNSLNVTPTDTKTSTSSAN